MTTLLELCWQHGNCQQQKIFKIRSDWLPRSCCDSRREVHAVITNFDSRREAHAVIPNLLHYSQTYKILFTRPWNVLEYKTTARLLNNIFESIQTDNRVRGKVNNFLAGSIWIFMTQQWSQSLLLSSWDSINVVEIKFLVLILKLVFTSLQSVVLNFNHFHKWMKQEDRSIIYH